MTTPEVALRDTWHQLAGRSHDLLLQGLLGRHREPHRHYHTATHVMWVLRHVAELAPPAASAAPFDLAAVQLAALYHDAVYDPRSSDNEAHSATLAAGVAAELGWAAPRCALVHRLVLATAHLAGDAATHAAHDATGAVGGTGAAEVAVLLDADLAILGAAPNDYTAYASGVRAEYAHVPEPQWRAGRAAVLRALLAMQPLYRTPRMRSARESRARANLTAELATLAG
ncbi:MAG: metal-dependent phosphohydrolase [Actinomycetota bacterium]|nr:metal-dependent phosphohydrolase [Actinomycetota bacterium]